MKYGVFLPVSALAAIKEYRLPVSKTDGLADPFLNAPSECRLTGAGGISEDEYHALLADQYEALPEHLRGFINFDYFCQQAESKKAEIQANHQAAQRWPPVDRKRYSALGVIRLFELHENMEWPWVLPGKGHQYMMLVLELDDARVEQWLRGQPYKWGSVSYSTSRPKTDANLEFKHLFYQPESMAMLREWRIVIPWSIAREGLALPVDAFKEMHFGALFDLAKRQAFQRYCHFDQHFRHIPLYQAVVQREQFCVRSQPLDAELMMADKA